MDILLLDPPYTSLKGMPGNKGYNIGLTSLAAFLRREGIETAVLTGDVIVGSFHPTFCPEEIMQNQNIDFIVRGEGEISLLRLVRELKTGSPKWENVPGITFRDKDGKV